MPASSARTGPASPRDRDDAVPNADNDMTQGSRRHRHRARAAQGGLTLIELLIVAVVFGVISLITTSAYQDHRERARVSQAVADILGMSAIIQYYINDNGVPPETLAVVRMDVRLDPWGRPYQYTSLATETGKGAARKDKNLNPLNSDFDLYSMGKDGETKPPLTPKESQDDVIRARDGRFVGPAKDFDP